MGVQNRMGSAGDMLVTGSWWGQRVNEVSHFAEFGKREVSNKQTKKQNTHTHNARREKWFSAVGLAFGEPFTNFKSKLMKLG